MNGRERFLRTLSYRSPDRPPLFEDGIREDVLRKWRTQGLGRHGKIENLFTIDWREEIEPDLEPIPTPTRWPSTTTGFNRFSIRLDPDHPGRLPDGWDIMVDEWRDRDYPLILRVHRGYFLTMGVHGWHRFTDAISLLIDNPSLVHAWMDKNAELSCVLVERILRQVRVDAALFSEPIGGNHGPLISPAMYSAFVLSSYQPILQALKSHGVSHIIYRTYANTRQLLPEVVLAGFNCLWACECNPHAMDYRSIRQEFGKDLRLIGGIDSDALRSTKDDISRVMMDTLPPLLQDGGYIPLADGRMREDVPFENYAYYRSLLEQIASP